MASTKQWPSHSGPHTFQPSTSSSTTYHQPEFDDLRSRSHRPSSASSAINWLARLLARSPRALADKRAEFLLPANNRPRSKSKSSSRSASPSRRSTDLESQASTLFDDAALEKQGQEPAKTLSSASSPCKSKIDARVVSDVIIGLSDGLTVPFALTAGLSALGNTKVVIFAGLAELTAGAISMGLGGYLAAKSEEESYKATLKSTKKVVCSSSEETAQSIREIFEPYDLPSSLAEELTIHLAQSPDVVQFLMNFQHNAPEQEASRAMTCALTIASGYFMGGFLPLIPYFFVGREKVLLALYWSFGFMALSLFSFGYSKTCFYSGWSGSKNVWAGCKGGVQMMLVGGTAAICAMSLVRVFDSFGVE